MIGRVNEKRKNKKRRKAKAKVEQNLKLSEIIINFAGDYIDLGDTLERKQSYRKSAVEKITLLKCYRPYRGKNDTELILLRKDYGVIYGKKNEEKIEEKKEIQ